MAAFPVGGFWGRVLVVAVGLSFGGLVMASQAGPAALAVAGLIGAAVWAYGSRVKGTARPNSDLDLVVFTTPEQLPLVSELKDELAESSNIPFLVDLHVWDEIPERFREIIRKEYVVLQEAEEKRGRLLSLCRS